jgi:Na+/H+ antiporter NhaA
VLWVAVLKSGVHATLAGVVTRRWRIPLRAIVSGRHRATRRRAFAASRHLEHALHPWVAYG